MRCEYCHPCLDSGASPAVVKDYGQNSIVWLACSPEPMNLVG